MDIYQMALAGKRHPGVFVDAPRLFVQVHTFVVLHKLWLAVIGVFNITLQLVWVEIVLLPTK